MFQYKEAFLNANPDFKWYKLPAPPLRTSSRPSESHDKSPTEEHEPLLEKTNNNSTKLDFNNKIPGALFEKPLSMFTPGKLADEAQMGGISSLLVKTEPKSNKFYSSPFQLNTISNENVTYRGDWLKCKLPTGDRSIQELQNALSETTRVFEHYDKSKLNLPLHHADQFTNQDVIDKVVDKRYSSDDYTFQKHWSDDEKNLRPGRSCKGKRYQEFMAVGGLIAHKRQRRELSDKSPEEEGGWEGEGERGELEPDHKPHVDSNEDSNDKAAAQPKTETAEIENNSTKAFNAADFDLDEKIKALPSLSYEKFQQKKRDSKRTRKAKVKPEPPLRQTVYDERPDYAYHRETLVGSQKRKPKKISITRLEISSFMSSASIMQEEAESSPDMKLATEAPCTAVRGMDLSRQASHHFSDLMALATLAEVAANTSKMDEGLARSPYDHASKV